MEKNSISNLLHFVGENDINASRTQRDRKRASLSPNSKATKRNVFSGALFSRVRNETTRVARRSARCESARRERNRNEFEQRESAESVHAGRRLETPETIARGFDTREHARSDHRSERNNRRDSVFGGILKANSSFFSHRILEFASFVSLVSLWVRADID